MEPIISGGQAGSAGDWEGSRAEAFAPSRACFEELITTLADPEGGRLTHAQMEQQLTMLSRELVRTLHLDSPAAVLVYRHTVYDQDDRPIEFAEAIYPPDAWTVEQEYPIES